MTPDPIWCLMPLVNNPAMTRQATLDLLDQSVPTRVLLIAQGASAETLTDLRQFAEAHHPQVLLWAFSPALPSLSGGWNRALRFVWELGGTEALVVNNDVRVHRQTVEVLGKALRSEQALFVSAVGVKESQFDPAVRYDPIAGTREGWLTASKGGPDFSCFLLSRKGHEQYPFDVSFIPAYCEDLDTHRRYLLGGDGARIFSVNLPFLHYASGTIKDYTPEERATFNAAYAGVVARYTSLWGGGPNQETYLRKGDPTSAVADGSATTPYLQHHLPSPDPVSGTISPTMDPPIEPNFLYEADPRD